MKYQPFALSLSKGSTRTAIQTSPDRPNMLPSVGLDAAVAQRLQQLREAAQVRHKVAGCYQDGAQQQTQRVLRPLGRFDWGAVWTVAAWSALRNDFRRDRGYRFTRLTTLQDRFADEPGRSLQDLPRKLA